MKKLPIGISTFKKIIDGNYLYVDKTQIAFELINSGQYYFLSRPRRFGKSLFLDTLKSIFQGNKELFKGLYIYDKYDFKPHPIVTLVMSDEFLILDDLKKDIKNQLLENSKKYDISLKDNEPHFMFSQLLRELHQKYSKKVVVLIDDADKPFREIFFDDSFKAIHNFLLGFYIVTKSSDEHIKFAMMTGIYPIKGSMLFGFNNLNDITLTPKYSNICGYTQNDIETTFKEHLKGQDFDKIKLWYNGYKWLGEGVYNPFDILLFIDKDFTYKNYWFNTGTPTFLLKLIEKNNYFLPNFENIVQDEMILDSFDVDNIELETLMWQNGYLTIDKMRYNRRGTIEYLLKIPNFEVKTSLSDFIKR